MRLIAAGCVVTVFLATTGYAQVRDRVPGPAPALPTAPASDGATLAAGWNAIAAGQYAAAVSSADRVLQRRPWDRAAFVLKITALAAASPKSGLDVYERWISGNHADDAGLLEPIAIATLQEIAKASDPELQRPALTALAAARVEGAQQSLDALAAATPDGSVVRDVAAAHTGDPMAIQRLTGAASTPAGGTRFLARALAELGSAGEPGLLMLLRSSSPEIRTMAVKALGGSKSERTRTSLQGVSTDPDPLVRLWSTVSLARMGDERALAQVDQMLASPAPDVQLAAARAWEGRPGPWVPIVRTLLDNQDGLTRIDAAGIIAPIDPEAARRILGEALGNANPVIRLESAKVLDSTPMPLGSLIDLSVLRQQLRDTDPHVRLAVAGILLRLARS